MRFMVLGGLSASLYPFERLAAQWRTKVLADGDAHSAATRWRGVLLGAVFVAKRGPAALRVYRMTSRRAENIPENGLLDLMEEEESDENKMMGKEIEAKLRQLESSSSKSSADGIG
eukprot:Hpha_TRINITY_DN16667_c1_g4::TRINITY_DN16667_c1_g4_i2::g.178840::m.178840